MQSISFIFKYRWVLLYKRLLFFCAHIHICRYLRYLLHLTMKSFSLFLFANCNRTISRAAMMVVMLPGMMVKHEEEKSQEVLARQFLLLLPLFLLLCYIATNYALIFFTPSLWSSSSWSSFSTFAFFSPYRFLNRRLWGK